MTDSKTEYEDSYIKEDTNTLNNTIDEKHVEADNAIHYTIEERRLVRKLDFLFVMPCVAILNFLQVNSNMIIIDIGSQKKKSLVAP